MQADINFRRLLFKISQAYYEDGLTQQQIGLRYGISRVKVSRLLTQAKEQKVVQIILSQGDAPNADLEHILEQKFGMDEVVVVNSENGHQAAIAKALGSAAADCLNRSILGDEVLAITWGSTLLSVVEALTSQNWPELRVVQCLGGLSQPDSDINGAELARRMAQRLNAKPLILSSPGLVDSRSIRDALVNDVQISRVLSLAAGARIALVGVGALTLDSPISKLNILNPVDLERLKDQGAVGEIGLRFFNRHGERVIDKIDDQIVGLELEQYQNIQRVIGVAGGEEKTEAIRAVLRARLVDVLVLDKHTAVKILNE
jgi:deoxyribonucleoside regulator